MLQALDTRAPLNASVNHAGIRDQLRNAKNPSARADGSQFKRIRYSPNFPVPLSPLVSPLVSHHISSVMLEKGEFVGSLDCGTT